MYKISKGEVIRITGSVRAIGRIYWIASGKEPVFAADVNAGEVVTLGPYLAEANFRIDMKEGSFIAQSLTDSPSQVPIPVADFVEGGNGISTVNWSNVTNKPNVVVGEGGISKMVKLSQAEYDGLITKDESTAYFIVE